MATDFKHELGEERIKVLSSHLSRNDPNFDQPRFIGLCVEGLTALSLMQRNQHIVSALHQCLPSSFPDACNVLAASLAADIEQQDDSGIRGWITIPLSEYVGQRSHENYTLALKTLARMTACFSSEWGIRHVLKDQFDIAQPTLIQWTKHPNEHIRRLASEGSRPRLPWGMQLKNVMANPELTFSILDALKDDPSEYVRRSVANHLNDIAKDHPDWLITKISPWWADVGRSTDRTRLIRHALRTLIKQGHKSTLSLLGYQPVSVADHEISIGHKTVEFGNALNFDLQLSVLEDAELVLDYAIHFKKSNGSLSPKVFKWKTLTLKADIKYKFDKKHTIKPITPKSDIALYRLRSRNLSKPAQQVVSTIREISHQLKGC